MNFFSCNRNFLYKNYLIMPGWNFCTLRPAGISTWVEIFQVIYHLHKFLVALWDWKLESETMLIMRKKPLLNCDPKSPKITRMTNLRPKNCKSEAMSCLNVNYRLQKFVLPNRTNITFSRTSLLVDLVVESLVLLLQYYKSVSLYRGVSSTFPNIYDGVFWQK